MDCECRFTPGGGVEEGGDSHCHSLKEYGDQIFWHMLIEKGYGRVVGIEQHADGGPQEEKDAVYDYTAAQADLDSGMEIIAQVPLVPLAVAVAEKGLQALAGTYEYGGREGGNVH